MAAYYVDYNGNITRKKKKKKKIASYSVDINGNVTPIYNTSTESTNSSSKKDKKLEFFQKGAYEDGYQTGDFLKSNLATVGDMTLGITQGALSLVEGVTDLAQYGVAGVSDLFGGDEFADKVRKNAQKNRMEQIFGGANDYLDQYSLLGDTSDAIVQGVGQVGAIMLTGGLAAAGGLGAVGTTALTTGAMGLSSAGSGMSEAYEGGATDGEAAMYGLTKGVIDAGTELLFGGMGKTVKALGLSKGLTSIDDVFARKLSSKISNQVAKNLVQFGVKSSAEGFEEVLAGAGTIVAKKLTYLSEEDWKTIYENENLLEQFVVGAVASGMMQSGYIPGTKGGSLREANASGRDFVTSYTQNEQAVIDKEFENRVKAEEENGNKLSNKEKTKLYDEVQTDFEKGRISIDTIESALGGETYTKYTTASNKIKEMGKEYNALNKMKQGEMTGEQIDRRAELKQMIAEMKNQPKALKEQLSKEVFELAKGNRISNSYRDYFNRGQKMSLDTTRYKTESAKQTAKNLVESGLMNNTGEAHDFADLMLNVSEDKGIVFKVMNTKQLKESIKNGNPYGIEVDPNRVEAFVSGKNNEIIVNLDAKKSLSSLVGHEVTHTVEGAGGYKDLQDALFTLAKTKGEYESRLDNVRNRYRGYSEEDIKKELTSDLLGDYLFTDSTFINNLYAEKPSLFKRIYNEIKYLYKMATAGSKEARELERVKKMFENVYSGRSTNNNTDTGTRLSVSDMEGKPIDESRISRDERDVSYSLKYNGEISEGQRDYVSNNRAKAHITLEELGDAQKVTNAMVDVMMKYSSILPEDKIGKVITNNGSYDKSVENTTICVRTLAYNQFVDKVQEEIGRPLTQMESFLVSQKLYDIATDPQCLYCYVSLDRKAFNDMLLRYMNERDTVIAKYNNSDKSAETIDALYDEYLHGRKPTTQMRNRFDKWIKYVDNGTQLLSLADISTESRQNKIKNDGGILAEQLKDARAYSQSASWSKIQKDYVAYRDEILKLGDRVVDNLNKHYGLRWYSFSDYSPAFIVENMQQITDASIRGLKGLAYTKDTDFAEIFAPSGMNINISVFVNTDENGNFFIDEKQSANFEQALALREKFSNVGIVATVTNDEALRWAGSQEWSDVIIPFHIVRTGTDVAEYYKWLNYTGESGDKIKDQNLWDAYVNSLNLSSDNARKKVSKNIYPSEHKNNKDTYLNLCDSRGLTPRFVRFAGEDWYMKLVNETRLSSDESPSLKPNFDLGVAKASFEKFVEKGGYYDGWYKDGVDVDAEASIVARDVLEGKKANEVDYGRQDNFVPEDLVASRKKNRQHGKNQFSLSEEIAPTSHSLSDSNYGYHAGDLGKAESLSQQGYGRDTGHFGTGTYFVGNEDAINISGYKERPHEKVDFSKYNLYKVYNSADGYRLHDFLRGIDGFYDLDENAIRTEREWERRKDDLDNAIFEEEISEEDAIKEARILFGNYDVGRVFTNMANSIEGKSLGYDGDGNFYLTDMETYQDEEIPINELNKYVDVYDAINSLIYDNRYAPRIIDRIEAWDSSLDINSIVLFGKQKQDILDIINEVKEEIANANYSYEGMKTVDSASTRFMKKLGYEGVDVRGTSLDNTTYGSVIYDLKGEDLARKQEIGTARYSLSDSEGRTLTKEQREFFKDSKARDENGNLMVVYHGTKDFGFTVFDANKSDDNLSLFFTNDKNMANTYVGDETKLYETYLDIKNPYVVDAKGHRWNQIRLGENEDAITGKVERLVDLAMRYDAEIDFSAISESLGNVSDSVDFFLEDEAEYMDGDDSLYTDAEKEELRRLAREIDEAYYNWDEEAHLDEDGEPMNMSTYLLDHKLSTKYNTRQISKIAKDLGHDGVIIKNVYDNGKHYRDTGILGFGNVYIAFDSNQIKSVDNTNPTEDADIRYSLSDSDGRTLSKEQQEYFKDSKVRWGGKLMPVYHGTFAKFTEFEPDDFRYGFTDASVGFNWATKDKEYAEGYTNTDDEAIVMKGYLNITNPLDVGDINSWRRNAFEELADLIGVSYDELISMSGRPKNTPIALYEVTGTKAFMDRVIELGYDGVVATENGVTTYGFINSNQFKNIDNTNPTEDADIRYSLSDNVAPTFYSHMGRVISDTKQSKLGADSVIPYLKGKGVKDEEIKWSGIEEFLEGKKSVTKEELEEFAQGSMLQIEEETLGQTDIINLENLVRNYLGKDLEDYVDEMDGSINLNELRWDVEDYYNEESITENEYREIRNAITNINDGGTKWHEHTLDGGENYRELLFRMPNSDYSNASMKTHWGKEGILAHARMQDFETDNGKMLFIEEIQSDWHNAGQKHGYRNKTDSIAVYNAKLEEYIRESVDKEFGEGTYEKAFEMPFEMLTAKEMVAVEGFVEKAERKYIEENPKPPKHIALYQAEDTPFRNNYHEYVLKRLIRMASEEGYDSIGWTTGELQERRWSSQYAEGYRIEYDQDIPKFLRKYGKKWGAEVDKTVLDNGNVVWRMNITDAMRDSVMHEGQPMYRISDGIAPTEYGDFNIYGEDVKLQDVSDFNAPTNQVVEANKMVDAPIKADAKPIEESEAPKEQIAQILTEIPTIERKKDGFFAQAMEKVVDKGYVFEKLAKQTKNRELEGTWNSTRYAEGMAQHFIGKGKGDIRALRDIQNEVEKMGVTKELSEYVYHLHNVDRMSLEKKANEKAAQLLKENPILTKLTKMKHLKDIENVLKDEFAQANIENLLNDEKLFAEIEKIASKDARKQTAKELKGILKEYLNLKATKNKAVFGDSVTADVSRETVAQFEKAYPQFKGYAKELKKINDYLREMLVDGGVISRETADLWAEMYPHYMPISRNGEFGPGINVPLDTRRTGVNAPVKQATGGNSDILPLFDTMAKRISQTYKAVARNKFGVELKNTLNTVISSESTDVDGILDNIDQNEELLQKGKNGRKPTFTVFEDGKRVTFEIEDLMYEALQPTSKFLSQTHKIPNKLMSFHRGLLTEYNPSFMIRNPIKDSQDVLINSQHPAKTYANFGRAINEMRKNGKWFMEYMENGGEQNTYFDKSTNKFVEDAKGIKRVFGSISKANNFVERLPRLAEYIASREMGRSIEVSMLDAARVTTNFSAGGDVTKYLNRNGATFLNASVQGTMQQVRNIQEAKMNGLKGVVLLASKFAMAGIPFVIANALRWEDDEDYEELSDYVKQNYYIVAKYGDGKFVRIPKGRMLAVIQDAFQQTMNVATGNDEADIGGFLQLAITNLAPNNPMEDNIIAPIIQVANNKTWYGDDLVPTRLQKLPTDEQYDETTDSISKWLGEKTGFSPYKINYLLDQYSGAIGDTFLPMLTPEAESGNDGFLGNLTAPIRDAFTTDSTLKNQNVTDFYNKSDELTTNANSMNATDEDILMNKYFNSISAEVSELYKQKREAQNLDLSDSEKYELVREIQKEINALTSEALDNYDDVDIDGSYATVGGKHFRYTDSGWTKVTDKQLEKQTEVTEGLGISAGEYWNNKEEHDFAYENPGKYSIANTVGGFDVYKQYLSDLDDIRADKDANGNSISGSAKRKKAAYINNLDLDYGQKIILYRSIFDSNADKNAYNRDIVEYLNSRDDISREEMITILEELGFTIYSDGTVSW